MCVVTRARGLPTVGETEARLELGRCKEPEGGGGNDDDAMTTRIVRGPRGACGNSSAARNGVNSSSCGSACGGSCQSCVSPCPTERRSRLNQSLLALGARWLGLKLIVYGRHGFTPEPSPLRRRAPPPRDRCAARLAWPRRGSHRPRLQAPQGINRLFGGRRGSGESSGPWCQLCLHEAQRTWRPSGGIAPSFTTYCVPQLGQVRIMLSKSPLPGRIGTVNRDGRGLARQGAFRGVSERGMQAASDRGIR